MVAISRDPGAGTPKGLCPSLPPPLSDWALLRMLRSGTWDAQAVLTGMADKVLRFLPPAADGQLYLLGDTTHKPKRGRQHPVGHVTRQSESSPYTFGFDMVILVARGDRCRIPVAMAPIDPARTGHQNILFRQMLKACKPPAWVREVVVVADAGYPANATLKLIEELQWTDVFAMPRTRKFPPANTCVTSSTTCQNHPIAVVPRRNRMAGAKISGSVGATPSGISWAMSRSYSQRNGETLGRSASRSS